MKNSACIYLNNRVIFAVSPSKLLAGRSTFKTKGNLMFSETGSCDLLIELHKKRTPVSIRSNKNHRRKDYFIDKMTLTGSQIKMQCEITFKKI